MFLQTLSRLSRRLFLCAGLAVLPAGASLAVPTLSLAGPAGGVLPGATFAIDVRAGDVADLYAYQFTLEFDPALFEAVSVGEGPFLGGGGTTFFGPGTIDNTAGSVSFVFGTLIGPIAGVSGSGLLDSVLFRATAAAPASGAAGVFGLSGVLALDSGLETILLQTAGFTVSVVPEPGTAALFAVAAVLGLYRARRRGVAQQTAA